MIAPAPAPTARASRRAASGGARGALLVAVLGAAACDESAAAEPGRGPDPTASGSLAEPALTSFVNGVAPSALVEVPTGQYRPFLEGEANREGTTVQAFLLERSAVTRAQFRAFVVRNPKFRKSRIAPLFAERSYLANWTTDFELGERTADEPVTFVSWFAARAYCETLGRRLPTVMEWERAAGGELDSAETDARAASNRVAPAASGSGVHFAMGRSTEHAIDGSSPVFGAVWEWTHDFNSIYVPKGASARRDGDASSLLCGNGMSATDAPGYARFLRYSFRNSLKANYALKNLGFRCAKDRSR